MIKTKAVDLPLNDMAKREAIKEKLGFDVTRAIEIKNTKYDGESENENVVKASTSGRRTAPLKSETPSASGRRYKPITKE